MANQFLGLALFLMMLSFFIIMNGVSSYDTTKKELVLNSVSRAFSAKTQEIGLAPIVEPNPLQTIHSGDSLAQLKGLFGAHITNFKASKNQMGNLMQVSLPYEDFRRALDGKAKENELAPFLPTMITLLRSEKSGVPYKVDFVLNMPADPFYIREESPQTYTQALQRAADLTASLELAGLPVHLMSAGLAKGTAGNLDITFTRYEPFDPFKGDTP